MFVAQTHSTSSLIREQYMSREDGFFIATDFQTAGRGQTGNHWESEAGKNLTFSILLHRNWQIQHAWDINIAVALGICDALTLLHNCIIAHNKESEPPSSPDRSNAPLLPDRTDTPLLPDWTDTPLLPDSRLAIKWPNDIYIGDKKLCGTLIENFFSGNHITSSIVGIGLNVNQTTFLSDAPNPTSLKLEYGNDMEMDRESLLHSILQNIQRRLDDAPTHREAQRAEYLSLLYRNDGREYLWESDGERFIATVHNISELGELILQKKDGTLHAYHLKQVRHIL